MLTELTIESMEDCPNTWKSMHHDALNVGYHDSQHRHESFCMDFCCIIDVDVKYLVLFSVDFYYFFYLVLLLFQGKC